MGNYHTNHNKLDRGDILDQTFTGEILFRVTVIQIFRLESPVWVDSREYYLCRGYHFRSKRPIIIKKILITPTSTQELINMLAIDKILTHMNIRSLQQIFQTKNYYYIIYPYYEGNTFAQYINIAKKSFPLAQIKSFFKDLLSTLKFIHGHGIILRNFDPSNILYDGKNMALIGLSKARLIKPYKKKSKYSEFYIENYTSASYKAPEVLAGTYNQRADIWVVGLLLYQTIMGSFPIQTTNNYDLNEKIMNFTLDMELLYEKKVDHNIVTLLVGMLEKDPEKRISIGAALENDWFKYKDPNVTKEEFDKVLKNSRKITLHIGIFDLLTEFVAKRYFMDAEVNNLRAFFKEIDRNCNGVVAKDEMLYLVENMDLALTKQDINIIFTKYDRNKTGNLEFTEFLAAFMQLSSFIEDRKIEEFFDYLDSDQTNFIEIEELKKATGLNFETPEEKRLVAHFAGRDRKLNKKEFVEFMKSIVDTKNEGYSETKKRRASLRKPKH